GGPGHHGRPRDQQGRHTRPRRGGERLRGAVPRTGPRPGPGGTERRRGADRVPGPRRGAGSAGAREPSRGARPVSRLRRHSPAPGHHGGDRPGRLHPRRRPPVLRRRRTEPVISLTARWVVVDIEGTLTPTSQVHVTLYDYARPRLGPWI